MVPNRMKKNIRISDENYLIKHSAIIHIKNSLSLLERKIYNVLLKMAYSSLLEKRTHKIYLKEVKKIIGRDGNKYQDIKDSITRLVETSIEWNIFGADKKNEWGITTFLAGAKIKDNICSYSYSPEIIEFLANPNIYARINLIIQKGFKNKHALVLWEFFNERLCIAGNSRIEIADITVEKIKKVLGIEDMYNDFRIFNRAVMKISIDEINRLSDINVEMTLKKQARKVVAISFRISKKTEFIENDVNDERLLEELIGKDLSEPHDHFTENIEKQKSVHKFRTKDNQKLKQILSTEFRISEPRSTKLIAEYDKENIEKSLIYVREQIRKGQKLINIAAYTTKAIKEGWTYTDTEIAQNRKTKEELVAEAEEYLEKLEDEIKVESWWKVWMDIRTQIDVFEFRNWLAHLRYESEERNDESELKTVKLYVYNNSFIQKELKEKYSYKILQTWQSYDKSVSKIEIGLKKKTI